MSAKIAGLVACVALFSPAQGVSLSHVAGKKPHPMKSGFDSSPSKPVPPPELKPDDHTADVLDDGLNSAVSMEADVSSPHALVEADGDEAGLLESSHRGRRGKHGKLAAGKSWMPFEDWVLAAVDLVPKADPQAPEAKTDPAPVSLTALAELHLELTDAQKLKMRRDSSLQIRKEFVYPRLDFMTTAFSGDSNSNTDPVFLYLKNGGFRYTVGDDNDLVANRAVLPVDNKSCAKTQVKFSAKYCPSVKFPASIAFDAWRPFTMLATNEKEMKKSDISFQWVGPEMRDSIFDMDNFANDKKVKNFRGAFVFKREGQDGVEWRCQNNGYGFLGVKDFALNLHAVNKHHNKEVGKKQKASSTEKIARPLTLHVKESVEHAPGHTADQLVLIDAARKLSFVYPDPASDKTCAGPKAAPKDCFEVHGGFQLEAAGDEVLKLGIQPVSENDTTQFAQTRLRFNEASCPGNLDTASLNGVITEDDWHPAPYAFVGKHVEMAWIAPSLAVQHQLFGKCKDVAKAKDVRFGGAFVFRDTNAKNDPIAWRCMDRSKGGHADNALAMIEGAGASAFAGAATDTEAVVGEMVDNLSEVDTSVDNSAGMVPQSIDSVPGSGDVMSLPAKVNDSW